MPKDNEWTIEITPTGGYAPSYFGNSYSAYGNKNQAITITDCDLIDINV